MARRVAWTLAAVDDLEQAAEYIGRDSPRYSAALVREALRAARSLSTFSNRGRIVPELDNQNIREIFVGRYRLIYHVGAQAVSILGLIHGARDLGALWDRGVPGSPQSPE